MVYMRENISWDSLNAVSAADGDLWHTVLSR